MKYIGFLCGGFSVKAGRRDLNGLWTEEVFTEQIIHEYESYYLPEFVRFNLNPDAVEFGSMSRYHMPVGKTIDLGVQVTVPELKLYLMPFNMALFAVRVEIESGDINGITKALSLMRNPLKLEALEGFREIVLEPLKKTWHLLIGEEDSFDCSKLVEDGNKLKIFQIALLEKGTDKVDDKEVLLFELGTVAPVGSYDAKAIYSASEIYFAKLLKENKLSIFNNWSCLSLLDTLTILSDEYPEWLVKNWVNDYFGLIYIWQLFRKNYLLRLTRNFRFEKQDPGKLIRESYEFEKLCSFNLISYNFLPEEFKKHVEHGLSIEEDKQVLYHLIESEDSAKEKKADAKMNYLLFFMTCLTVFSTIYDACCLFNEIYPYEANIGSNMSGYRLFASAMLTVILLVVLLNRLLSNRKK